MRAVLYVVAAFCALGTFAAAVGVVIVYSTVYRWLTKDEEPGDFCAPEGAWGDNVRSAAFVHKPRPAHPRQTVAEIVTFNAYRARRKRGQA
jgi:hypothetical protein